MPLSASATATEDPIGLKLTSNKLNLIEDTKSLLDYQNRPLALIVIGIFLAACGIVMAFAVVRANIIKHALMDLEHHVFMETGRLDYEAQLLLQCGMNSSPLTRRTFWQKLRHAYVTEHSVVRPCPSFVT